jgi:hypothetical protein
VIAVVARVRDLADFSMSLAFDGLWIYEDKFHVQLCSATIDEAGAEARMMAGFPILIVTRALVTANTEVNRQGR